LLAELKVRALGIIDELDWSPEGGLNVISGETGAGKSLVATALKVLTDGRLDATAIRHGADLTRIEGLFCFEPAKIGRAHV
jgi:DNA repair protein RecN (Recombination protein N)